MRIGCNAEKKEENDKLLSDGNDNTVCADETKIIEGLHSISNTRTFCKVSNFPSNPPDYYQLKSCILSCSCVKCCKGTTCVQHSACKSNTNHLKLKVDFDSQTGEALKNCNLNKFTIPRLKTELLSQLLSASHKVKAELVQQLQTYLTSIL